jgi:hypothetical protein
MIKSLAKTAPEASIAGQRQLQMERRAFKLLVKLAMFARMGRSLLSLGK